MSDGYDIGLACLNGHAVNGSSMNLPQHNAKFCEVCGKKVIDECDACGTKIRGSYWGGFSTVSWVPAAFCFECGEAYPWTEARLAAATLLAKEAPCLTPDERIQLEGTFADLVASSPMTPVAANRFKRLTQKAGNATATSFRELLVEVVAESAKRAIWGPSV